ncbi:hypothetical protein [Streptomyces sioyaensis]|uniref:hypothetical protein n=1 Tax=Streptomyces sioyaensis TaxID=67364 RepID=UPI003D727471
MPARRRSKPPEPVNGLLVWTSSAHWSDTARPCRYCGRPTNLRDSKRAPAHKVCAEHALVCQQEDAVAVYRTQAEL